MSFTPDQVITADDLRTLGGVCQTVVVTTDAGGGVSIAYPRPFPEGTTPVPIASLGDGIGAVIRTLIGYSDRAQFRADIRNLDGSAYVGVVRINYYAALPRS